MSFVQPVVISFLCFASLATAAGNRPLYFEQRTGDLFETRTNGYSIRIRADGIEIDDVRLRFIHASPKAVLEGTGAPALSTYLSKGHTISFRQFPKVRVRRLYAGVDLALYATEGHLEYDLDLASGASAASVRLHVDGARGMRLDRDGSLIIEAQSGQVRQLAPRVFEYSRGIRRRIPAHFVLLKGDDVAFDIGPHDRRSRLLIDPVLVYQKYFGFSGRSSGGPIATDTSGNIYVTGSTNSVDFPSPNGTAKSLTPPLLAVSNAGQTVTKFPVGNQVSVTAIGGTPDGNVIYVATPDGIFVSGNHGASFAQTAPLGKPATVQGISVDVIDPARVFVATSAGLFSTDSAGQGWGENDFGLAVAGNGIVNTSGVLISPLDHTISFVTTAYPNYLYRTTSAGGSWQQLNPAYPGEPTVPMFSGTNIAMALTPDGKTLYVIDGNAFLLQSTDNGNTWTQLAGQLFGAKSIAIDPHNASNIYVVDSVGLKRSTNGGSTFATISPALQGGERINAFAEDATGALYFATTADNFQFSIDNGTTWTPLPRRPIIHALLALGGQVFAATDSPSVPFITKWTADGSQLLYTTFFGGSFFDTLKAVQVNAQGEAIVAGTTNSPDFPVTQTISAASQSLYASGFVGKISHDGSRLVYSTLLGASQGLSINGLAVDSTGAPYITGTTASPDFPTTAAAFQPKVPTAACQRPNLGPLTPIGNLGTYAFVSKLSVDGKNLLYSTFLTGACGSGAQGIAVDPAGEAVVAGYTTSPDFPVSANAYQSIFPGGAAASTDYPNPTDFGFITKLSSAGDKVVASSFIGGGFHTEANALALDSAGNSYITGSTWGITPGPTPGAYQSTITYQCFFVNVGPPQPPSGGSDVFLLKLDPTLSTASYLTYLGGRCDDAGYSILLAPNGNVWIGGFPSANFPLVSPFALPGTTSSFAAELSADASHLLYSTHSDGFYLAADATGPVYVSGSIEALPETPNQFFGSSVSLTKIDPSTARPVVIGAVGVSAANQTVANGDEPEPFAIAPGELIGISGQHLGPATTINAQLDDTGRIPFIVNATTVSFNGYFSPILSVQDGLIVCIAPFEISGATELTVKVDGQSSEPVRVAVIAASPYILTIVNQDGTLNGPSHPAPQGSVLMLYVSGLGVTTPLSQDGDVNTFPLPVPAIATEVAVNGQQVRPQFVGAAYGLAAGITQVNVGIPVAAYSSNPVNIQVNSAAASVYIVE